MALLIGAVGVVSTVLLLQAFRADGGLRGLTLTSLLLSASVLLPNMTTLVGMLRAERVVTTDAFFNRVVLYSGLSQQVNQVASPALLAVAILVIIIQLGRKTTVNAAALAFLLLLIIGALAKYGVAGAFMDGGQWTLLALVAAAVVLPRGHEALKGGALGVGLLLCISAVGALLQPDMAAPPCDKRKCGVLGTFYVGVADNQNTFGLLMAFAVPLLYFGLRRYRFYFAVLATFFAFASGSRTAAVAAGAAMVVILLVHVQRRSGGRFGGVLAILLTAGASASAIVIPLLGLPPETFSERVRLWQLAWSMIERQWLIGHGPNYWRSLVEIGVIPRAAGYSTHNQALEILFVAGALGAFVMVVVVINVLRQNPGGRYVFAIFMLPVAVAAVTERPWSLGAVDWASWSLLIFLCSQMPPLHGEDSRIAEESAPARAPQLSDVALVIR